MGERGVVKLQAHRPNDPRRGDKSPRCNAGRPLSRAPAPIHGAAIPKDTLEPDPRTLRAIRWMHATDAGPGTVRAASGRAFVGRGVKLSRVNERARGARERGGGRQLLPGGARPAPAESSTPDLGSILCGALARTGCRPVGARACVEEVILAPAGGAAHLCRRRRGRPAPRGRRPRVAAWLIRGHNVATHKRHERLTAWRSYERAGARLHTPDNICVCK